MAQYGSFQDSHKETTYNYSSAGSGNGPSSAQRLAVIIGIILAVIIVIMIFFSVVGGSDEGPEQDLARISARQKNIISLVDTYGNNIRNLETQSYAAQVEAIILSDTTSLAALGAGTKSTPVTDSSVTSKLDSAASSTNFDSVFTEIITAEIESNIVEMQGLLGSSSNANLREALTIAIKNQTALIE